MTLLFKLLGCGLMVLTGAGVGLAAAYSTQRRASLLSEMAEFLAEVSAALQCAPQPTAELLRQAQRNAGDLPLDFSSLSDGPALPGQVKSALISARTRCPEVPSPIWQQFSQAVERVGQQVTDQVLPVLECTQRRIGKEAQIAAERARQDRKLYRTLGVCAGAAVALLLL